jgi:hypothetical protein
MKAKFIYTILLISFFTLKSHSQNPIILNDLQPDERCYLSTDTIKIDINGDLLKDVAFYVIHRSGGDLTFVSPLSNSCKVAYLGFLKNDLVALNSDSLIWHSSALNFFNLYQNTNIGKIGIRLTIDNLIYYGWIKVYYEYIDWYKALYVDKYAFCTTANYPLSWGQTEFVGKNDLKKNGKVKISSNQNGNIKIQSVINIKEIRLIDLSGNILQQWEPKQTKTISLDALRISTGVYIIQVKLINNEVYSEKITL